MLTPNAMEFVRLQRAVAAASALGSETAAGGGSDGGIGGGSGGSGSGGGMELHVPRPGWAADATVALARALSTPLDGDGGAGGPWCCAGCG